MPFQERNCEENVGDVGDVEQNVGGVEQNVGSVEQNVGSVEQNIKQTFSLPKLADDIDRNTNNINFNILGSNLKIPGINEIYNPNSFPDLTRVNYLKILNFLKDQEKAENNVDQDIDRNCNNNSNVIIINSNNNKKPIINIKLNENEKEINFDELFTDTFFEQGCLNGSEIEHNNSILSHDKIHGINIYSHYDFFRRLFLFKKNLSTSEIKSLKNLKIKLINKSILKNHLNKSSNKNFKNHKYFKFLNNNNRNKNNYGKIEAEIENELKKSKVIKFKNRSTLIEYNPNEDVITSMETLKKINKIFEIKSSMKISINKNQLTEKSGALSCDNVDTEEFIKFNQLYELKKFQNLNSIAQLRLKQLEKYYNSYNNYNNI